MTWEPLIAALVVGTAFLGMAPLNIALGIGALCFVVHLVRRDYRFETQHIWLYGLGIYLAMRAFTALCSPEMMVSLRHLAKDWRLIALAWGATGVLVSGRRYWPAGLLFESVRVQLIQRR